MIIYISFKKQLTFHLRCGMVIVHGQINVMCILGTDLSFKTVVSIYCRKLF